MAETTATPAPRSITLSAVKRKYLFDFLHVLWKNRQSRLGISILGVFVAMAALGPLILKQPKMDYLNRYAMPTWLHVLGTDYSGRDTLVQLILGAQGVLLVSLFAAMFTVLFAMVVGLFSGFIGGKTDMVLMFIADVILTVPSFPVTLVLATMIRVKDPVSFGLILSIWSWAGLAKAIRTQVLSVKHQDFVESSRLMGISTINIVQHDILPNVLSFLAVNFVGIMKGSILASVGLMYLGLVEFQGNHWAIMITFALTRTGMVLGNVAGIIYFLAPTVGLLMFQFGCLMLSNGLDEAFNPRLRG
jgi:peptide/nickel transport system permease protein